MNVASASARAPRGACASPRASARGRRSRRCCVSTIGSENEPARDAIGGGLQPCQAPGERLGGERSASSATPNARAPPMIEPPLDRRDLLLDVAERRLRPARRRRSPRSRRRTSASAVRPPARLAALSRRHGAGWRSPRRSIAPCRATRRTESAMGTTLMPLIVKTADARHPERCPRSLQLRRAWRRLAELEQRRPGCSICRTLRAQRFEARLLEVVLQRRQDERCEHDEREQRRRRRHDREPHAQAPGALQRSADHAPKRYPTPRTVRISSGRGRIALELLAQVPDVHVDRALLAVVGRVPHALEQRAPRAARGRASASGCAGSRTRRR